MYENILNRVSEIAKEELKLSYRKRNFNTTGKTLSSIISQGKKVMAFSSIFTLIYGRKPSKKYPPWGYKRNSKNKTALMRWVMLKFGVSEKEAKTISFLIARKLKEQGNRIYQKKEKPLDIKTPIEKAKKFFIKSVNDNIKSRLK